MTAMSSRVGTANYDNCDDHDSDGDDNDDDLMAASLAFVRPHWRTDAHRRPRPPRTAPMPSVRDAAAANNAPWPDLAPGDCVVTYAHMRGIVHDAARRGGLHEVHKHVFNVLQTALAHRMRRVLAEVAAMAKHRRQEPPGALARLPRAAASHPAAVIKARMARAFDAQQRHEAEVRRADEEAKERKRQAEDELLERLRGAKRRRFEERLAEERAFDEGAAQVRRANDVVLLALGRLPMRPPCDAGASNATGDVATDASPPPPPPPPPPMSPRAFEQALARLDAAIAKVDAKLRRADWNHERAAQVRRLEAERVRNGDANDVGDAVDDAADNERTIDGERRATLRDLRFRAEAHSVLLRRRVELDREREALVARNCPHGAGTAGGGAASVETAPRVRNVIDMGDAMACAESIGWHVLDRIALRDLRARLDDVERKRARLLLQRRRRPRARAPPT